MIAKLKCLPQIRLFQLSGENWDGRPQSPAAVLLGQVSYSQKVDSRIGSFLMFKISL